MNILLFPLPKSKFCFEQMAEDFWGVCRRVAGGGEGEQFWVDFEFSLRLAKMYLEASLRHANRRKSSQQVMSSCQIIRGAVV